MASNSTGNFDNHIHPSGWHDFEGTHRAKADARRLREEQRKVEIAKSEVERLNLEESKQRIKDASEYGLSVAVYEEVSHLFYETEIKLNDFVQRIQAELGRMQEDHQKALRDLDIQAKRSQMELNKEFTSAMNRIDLGVRHNADPATLKIRDLQNQIDEMRAKLKNIDDEDSRSDYRNIVKTFEEARNELQRGLVHNDDGETD